MKNHSRQNSFVRAIKKLFLSAFVVGTFTAYALENRVTATGRTAQATGRAVPALSAPATTAAGAPEATALSTPTRAPAIAARTPAGAATTSPSATPTAEATATRVPTSTPNNGYKDGTYTGSEVYVNWGYVQVQATIQGSKISDVQFLEYPNDRRTSVRINSIANPELQQEAIQAQSAMVDIITGATLTSEGFQQSLQDALSQARS